MKSILVNIFAKGFYKKYAKAFLFGFCMSFSYCIYIQTAGEFLLETRDFWTMLISLKIATDPIFILIFWIFSLIYTVIFLKYLRFELTQERNSFIQYTLNGMKSTNRRSLWFLVLLVVFLPLLLFSIYSVFIGCYLENNLLGLVNLIYVFVLMVISVIYINHFRLFNISEKEKLFRISSFKLGKGQQYLLNLFNHINHNLGPLIASKVLSILTIYILIILFNIETTVNDYRYVIFVALTLSCFNSFLLYKDFIFEGSSMAFLLNFPINSVKRFILPIPYYLVLIIPEIIYIAILLKFQSSILAFCSIIIFMLAIRSFILSIGNRPLSVIKCISIYYFLILILILYGGYFIALILIFFISYFFFRRNYTYENLENNQN
ncbi:hypothetical protein ACFRAE_14445 [Sphingobacterium sp. HJSM2_6]|uniref:hypothetical protein n=1 Tax=Sphingobacterium sp. HJSM2_6 TaxID=3366264 RepID=UPI003BD9467D